MRIVLCDRCGVRLMEGIFRATSDDGDFCFACSQAVKDEACDHEDNVSDAVPGRDTARLICKACGYDRIEEVA